MRPELAKKLEKLTKTLKEKNLKLILFDCYRPLEVQRAMWKIVSDPKFVANPTKGSNHNRGVAIDVGLAQEEGSPLIFPTPFDDFTKTANHSYVCEKATKDRCQNRETLKNLMVKIGLKPLNSEWWHYELPNAKEFQLIERSYAQPK